MSLPERPRKRDRFLKPFSRGRSRSTSKAADTRQTATASVQLPNEPPGDTSPPTTPSVFDTALQTLSKDDRAFFEKHGDLSECLENAERLRELRYGERVKWTFRNSEHSLRGVVDGIVATLDQFKAAGDGLAEMLPQAAVPWAVVKVLLKVAVDNKKQRDVLAQGIERAMFCSRRLVLYEKEMDENMREVLVKLQVKILEFLAAALRSVAHNRVVAQVQPLWNLQRIEKFDEECGALLNEVARDAAARGRVVAEEHHVEVVEKLDLILDSQLFDGAVAEGATHLSKEQAEASKCLPETRTELLAMLREWAKNDMSIFWLCGQAGTGKSTISRTVACEIAASGYAVASFFFKRTEAKRSTARYLFATLLQQLSEQVELPERVKTAMRTHAMLTDRGLYEQWQKLIEPLHEMDLRVFLVIDALDECDLDDVKGGLTVLFGSKWKIFLTSRPEVEIVKWFKQGKHESFRLEQIKESITRGDIKLFIRHELDFATEDQVEALTGMTSPLFIAASTLCRFVLAFDPVSTLLEVTQGGHWTSDMAEFYSGVLLAILGRMKTRKDEYVRRFHEIVAPLVLLSDPLDKAELAELLGVKEETVSATLAPLSSVLSLEGRVRPLHLTFYEAAGQFQTPFAVVSDAGHDLLHRGCLRVMDMLKQDLLGVHHPGTKRRFVRVSMPPILSYACENWRRHMRQTDLVEAFLTTHLLHWLEAMSWLDRLSTALDDLMALSGLSGSLGELAQDARRFVQQNLFIFGEAPLQIYLNAVVFSPKGSKIRQLFGNRPNPYFKMTAPPPKKWDDELWTLPVSIRAFCVDTEEVRLAVVTDDHELYVVAVNTGIVLSRQMLSSGLSDITDLAFTAPTQVSMVRWEQLQFEIVQWDLLSGKISSFLEAKLGFMAVSRDYAYMTVASNAPVVWDEKTGSLLLSSPLLYTTASSETRPLGVSDHSHICTGVHMSNKYTALARGENAVFLYDNKTANCVWTLEQNEVGACLRLSPGSDILAILSNTQTELYILYLDDLEESFKHTDISQLQRIKIDPVAEGVRFLRNIEIHLIESIRHISYNNAHEISFVRIADLEERKYYLDSSSSHGVDTLRPIHEDEAIRLEMNEGAARIQLSHLARDSRDVSSHEKPPWYKGRATRYNISANFIATVTSKQIEVYDQAFSLILSLEIGGTGVFPQISPDEERLFYTSRDRSGKSQIDLILVTLRTGFQFTIPGQGDFLYMNWSPDSRYISCKSPTEICCIDARSGAITVTHRLERATIDYFSPDGRRLCLCSMSGTQALVKIYDVEGPLLHSFDVVVPDLSLTRRFDPSNCLLPEAGIECPRRTEPLTLLLRDGWITSGLDDILFIPTSQRSKSKRVRMDALSCHAVIVESPAGGAYIYWLAEGALQQLDQEAHQRDENSAYQPVVRSTSDSDLGVDQKNH